MSVSLAAAILLASVVTGITTREAPTAPRAVFVPPETAHGLWLELREGPTP